MAIHFISGKPGGGKTLYALKLIVEELVHGTRLVVTNVALKLPELNEFIQKRHPEASVDLFRRVRILKEEEASEFWKYRLPAAYVGEQFKEPVDVGAFIVLDELHLFFNARKWMETGEDCLHYLSQHRKLGDDVLCVTQHVENVDKQFRSVAQDFTVVKNGYTQKVGIFRGLPTFTRRTFPTAPNGGKQEAFETAHFRLDSAGLASCYDTAAGVGVHGRHADKGKKAKGLHPAWFIAAVAAFAALVFFGLKFGVGSQVKKLGAVVPVAEKASIVDTSKTIVSEVVTENPPMKNERSELVPDRSQVEFRGYTEKPVVEGKLLRGDGRVRVVLSDGRVLEADSEELEEIRRNRVKIAGEWFYYKRPQPRPPQGSPLPASAQNHEEKSEPLPPPPAPPESSWQTFADGVQRLKQTETLADMVKR